MTKDERHQKMLGSLKIKLEAETAEKQHIQDQLVTIEQRFRAKFDGTPVPVFSWQAIADDFVFVDYNNAAMRLCGPDLTGLLSKKASEIYPGKSEFFAALHDCFTNRQTLRHEAEFQVITTGELKLFDVSFVFVPPNEVMVHAHDISAGRLAEEALKASEERFRLQFKGTPVPIFCWQRTGDDFTLVNYNDAAVKISHGMIPTLLGKKASEVYRERPIVIEYLERCFEDKATVRRVGEFKMLSTGENKFFDASFVYVPPDLILVHTEDITERKRAEDALREAEQKYRDIFENASEGIFQTTPEGRITTANPAFAEMLGFDSPDQLMAERTDLANQHYVDPGKRAEFVRLMEATGVVTGFEHEVYRRDGKKLWMTSSIRAVKNYEGRVLYYEGMAADITERKLAEEALRVSESALHKFSRKLIDAQENERQHIARELHDEIGQVLTAVRINLQRALQLCESDPAFAHIQDNIGIVDEALRQVHDLSLELRPSLLDDLGLVSALHWYFKRFAHRTGIEVMVNTQGFNSTDRFARELETACFRIAQEALTNVARHARARNAWLALEKQNGEFLLSVKDDGVGLDLEVLKESKAAAEKLGLLGMEERALAVGGHLEIISQAGSGTEIRAHFPLTVKSKVKLAKSKAATNAS